MTDKARRICPTCTKREAIAPFLNHMEWYPEACRFKSEVLQSIPNLDFELLKKKRPGLYSAIGHLEYLIDEKGDGDLSGVIWL